MKPIKGLAFVFVVFVFSCDTASNVPRVFETFFTKYYGADGNQTAVDLLVNPDGTMVILGNTTSQISNVPAPYIVKIDNLGNVLWQRQLGGQDEQATDIESDGGSGYLIVSNTKVALPGDVSQIRVYDLDQNGRGIDSVLIDNTKKINNETSSSPIAQTGLSITHLSDGTIFVVGTAGPEFVRDNEAGSGIVDKSDLLAYQFKTGIHTNVQPIAFITQAGEKDGQIVKAFQSSIPGDNVYLFFGDSDRPVNGSDYVRRYEAFVTNDFGGQKGVLAIPELVANETQIASTAIAITGLSQDAFLTVGTSNINSSSSIFIFQYVINNFSGNGVVVRVNKKYDFYPRMEGKTAAVGRGGDMYVLGNVTQDNNKHDVVLIKVDSEGNNESHKLFGAVEGDDLAAAVSVLPDGRIAVVATIELETQKKIALFMLSPDGTYVPN